MHLTPKLIGDHEQPSPDEQQGRGFRHDSYKRLRLSIRPAVPIVVVRNIGHDVRKIVKVQILRDGVVYRLSS